jgi:hypothetical protein
VAGSSHDPPKGEASVALEKEVETYKAKLPELKEHEGKFVLIKGETVVDVYSSYEDAIKQGYEHFKLEPFLVKQIHSIEEVQFISRFLEPCTT